MLSEHLIINLLLILAVAWAFGALFTKFGLPIMLGELLAGIVLGPPLLGVVQASDPLQFLADLGIFFAMFYAGMEMDPKELVKHIWPSLAVAIGGFFVPFGLGYYTCWFFGGTLYQSLFVGMGLSITAIAVQAVILQNMQVHRTKVGHIIIGAAIADDILSLISLSILLGLAQSGTVETAGVLIIVLKVVLFFAFTILVGHFVIPVLTKRLQDFDAKGFTFALISALVMAGAAEAAGLHLVIGAFLAGQFVRKEIMDEKIYYAISDRFFGISYGFLMPVFFASLAFHLHLEWSWHFFVFAIVLTFVAVVGKFLGAWGGAKIFGHSNREATVIGFGMNGRGAVELVVAAVVIELSNELIKDGTIADPLLTQQQFSALVLMAFVTTLLTPILLKRSVTRSCSGEEKEAFCELWEQSNQKKIR
jgi:Kef-type K+ transport system membrane component KefB